MSPTVKTHHKVKIPYTVIHCHTKTLCCMQLYIVTHRFLFAQEVLEERSSNIKRKEKYLTDQSKINFIDPKIQGP